MDDLRAFLGARLDEDEAAAKTAAAQQVWRGHLGYQSEMGADPADPGWHDFTGWFNPERRLREVDAKRAILAKHATCSCPESLMLAAVYSDHPDYRDEWKP